jgi:phospholipase/lecithinase/hemolysin
MELTMRIPIRQTLFNGLAAIVLVIASGSACAALYSSLIVFGDSLLDNGNGLLLNAADPGVGLTVLGRVVPNDPRQPAYPPGATKYTNPGGVVAVEVLAGRLGLPLAPSVAGGTNFAIGGATTGTLNLVGNAAIVPNPSPIPGVPAGTPFYPGLIDKGIQTEIAAFAAGLGGASADPNALYVLWGGANDIFLNSELGLPQDPVTSVNNLATSVAQLYGLGARTILMPNLPDLGKTPAVLGTSDAAGATAVTLFFNALLAGAVPTLESALPGLDIIPFDTFDAFNDVLANLGAFGLTNSTDPCSFTAGCDPSQFVFSDLDHPTAALHRILGDLFFVAAVPEPGTLTLLAFALASVFWLRKSKTADERAGNLI